MSRYDPNTLLRTTSQAFDKLLKTTISMIVQVIPLTPCLGLVQWVPKTMSLSECLTSSRGAHILYRPPSQQKSVRDWFELFKTPTESPEAAETRFRVRTLSSEW